MKLFLASEGKHPDSMAALTKFVGGNFRDKKVVYIVTAANGEMGYGSWRGSETLALLKSLVAKVDVVELENYRFENTLERISGHDIIWFAGGMPGYLMYWIRRVGLAKKLPELLKKSVYVGSSAGSMIAAKTLYSAERFPGDEEFGAHFIPGLGLVDFEIAPHYDEAILPVLKKNWNFGKLYLIKNGEVITVVDGKVKVLGKERILG